MNEIKRLKAEARALYMDVHKQLDSVDCGLSLLCYIRPSVGRDLAKFKEVWAKLQDLDPDCPKESPL
jgi:hypothetical protein